MPGILNSGATPPSNERTLEVDCPQACGGNDESENKNRINATSADGNTKNGRMDCFTQWPCNLAPVSP